jgi:hypothetical protein
MSIVVALRATRQIACGAELQRGNLSGMTGRLNKPGRGALRRSELEWHILARAIVGFD